MFGGGTLVNNLPSQMAADATAAAAVTLLQSWKEVFKILGKFRSVSTHATPLSLLLLVARVGQVFHQARHFAVLCRQVRASGNYFGSDENDMRIFRLLSEPTRIESANPGTIVQSRLEAWFLADGDWIGVVNMLLLTWASVYISSSSDSYRYVGANA